MCEFCKQGTKLQKKDHEKYKVWKEKHEKSGDCQKNFDGSSSAMEAAAANIMWNRSVEKHRLQYTDMVCDGDSKAYNDVWDIYRICNDCEKYEKMNKKSVAYQQWENSEEFKKWEESHWNGEADCKRVKKLDCIGHVQKRMGKNLISMTKNAGKLNDGKGVGGRSGRLTRPCIDKLQNHYGNAIRKNVDKSAKTNAQVDTVIQNMQTAIKASLYHSVKLEDPEERHQFCPKGKESWCSFQKQKAGVNITFENSGHHLDPVFLAFLMSLYDRLSDKKLLKRCVPGFSQNANESLNALVWNRCPKHRNKGFRQVEVAAGSAALRFNIGASGRHGVMDEMQIPPGDNMKKGSAKKDKDRIRQSLQRATKTAQKYRQIRRNAMQREEERRKAAEGVTYASGAFNEELLCVPNSRKRGSSSSKNTSTSSKRKKK